MTMERAFYSTEHGTLFHEFIDWLVEEPNRKLARKVWLIMTTDLAEGYAEARCEEIGALFAASTDETDFLTLAQTFVNAHWPEFPPTMPRVLDIG